MVFLGPSEHWNHGIGGGMQRLLEKQCQSRKDAGRDAWASSPSLAPISFAQTCQEAREQRSPGDAVGRVSLAELRSMDNGLGAHGEPLQLVRLWLETPSPVQPDLRIGTPRPHCTPRSRQGGSYTPTLRMSMETSPKAKWK